MLKIRDYNADALRGLAIVLVIILHVSASERYLDIKNTLDLINYFFTNIRIPLFTIISGYFFAYLHLERKKLKDITIAKIKRAVLPMYLVLTLEIIYLMIFKSNNEYQISELYKYYIYSYDHYWFVQAIFAIFIFHTFTIKTLCKNHKSRIILFIASCVLYIFGDNIGIDTNFFSLGGAIYLYPYFLAGSFVPYLKTKYEQKTIRRNLLFLSICLLLLQLFSYKTPFSTYFDKRTILGLGIGLAFCCYLLNLNLKNKILSKIGAYSFSIYILQSFGIKLSTIVFYKIINIQNSWISIIFVTLGTIAFGIMVSIVITSIFKKAKYVHDRKRKIRAI